jgi:hypothetical protein
MVQSVQKRRTRRFEIPGAKVRYKKIRFLVLASNFSDAYPVMNISEGGLAFACEERLGKDRKLLLQLLVPNETPMDLRAQVQWQECPPYRADKIVGVKFMPFGSRRGWNSHKSLNVLRKLDAQYANKENEKDDVVL